MGASEAVVRANQREVIRQAATFLADLIGEDSPITIGSGEEPLSYLASYLRLIRPLFPMGFGDDHFWNEIIDEIWRMPYGDEPSILKPKARLPGQPARPALIATRRLKALEWAAYFNANNLKPADYQSAISLAFGSDWDTIRHWQKSVSKTLGHKSLERALDSAAGGYFIAWRRWHKSIMDPLWIDGLLYRDAVGVTGQDKEVIHDEWERLTLKLSMYPQAYIP